jgi:phosphatidate cytidylyltransferase
VNNLATRTITGLGFIIVIIGSALLGQNVFSFLFLFITILGLWEFYGLIEKGGAHPNKIISILGGVLLFVTLAINASGYFDGRILLLNIPMLFVLVIAELWRLGEKPFENIAYSILGIVYIALPFGLMTFFFNPVVLSGPLHYGIVLGYLIILWSSDTGAYVIGSLLGKHRLFERISPKKSWEGSIGGALFALLVTYGISFLFTGLSLEKWFVIASLVIVFGTLGDLSESLLKRSLDIKDSGNILPGHGGILDRFDAVLISVPFVFVFLTLFC